MKMNKLNFMTTTVIDFPKRKKVDKKIIAKIGGRADHVLDETNNFPAVGLASIFYS